MTITAIQRTGQATANWFDATIATVRDDAPQWQPVYGQVHVEAILDDGTTAPILVYYSDELSFSRDDLAIVIGQDVRDGATYLRRLHQERDAAYLRRA